MGRLTARRRPQLIQGPILKQFLETNAGLALDLIACDQLGDIVSEGFDLPIRLGEPRVSTLIARRLWDTRILTVAAPSYLKRRGRPRTPQELQSGRHLFIDFRETETGRNFQWEFHRAREIVKVATGGQLTVSDVVTLHRLCLAGFGIGQVMEFGVEKFLADAG